MEDETSSVNYKKKTLGIFNVDRIWILAQSPGIALVLFVVCGIISLFGSFIYIELGIRSLPRGIGEQKYITDAFPEWRNFGHVFSFVVILFGLVKLAGTGSTNWRNVFNISSNIGVYEVGAYGNCLIQILFAYEDLTEELKEPKDKNLTYSSTISVVISFLLYFFTNVAFITVVGNNIIDNDNIPIALRFGKELHGGTGEILMSILVAISAFGSASAMVFIYARIIKYAAETEFIPVISDIFKNYNRRFDTLTNQLLAQFGYCFILTMLISIKANCFVFSSNTSQYLAIIFHGASAYSLWRLKKRLGEIDAFPIPKYIIIIYLSITVLIIIASFFPPDYGNFDYLIPYCISCGAVILGLIFWYIRDYNSPDGEIDQDPDNEPYELEDQRNGEIAQNFATDNDHDIITVENNFANTINE
ncbi:3025_t:CDS:10 [Dentiscutata erythropus]|uniref:3025_t:CDS:1 n=1 Tax=Dentiscutata erythropus TaxID=1348616 RepID=A0A9N9EAX3_9GLOM|nr:3025_t:CDS:10 [Dentiscutata erythropus]